MKRVLIIDADRTVRSSIALLLKHKFGIREISEINDAGLLFERMQQHHPDLILLDWELPGLDVTWILSEFYRSGIHPVLIAMSTHTENEPWALASGADAFLNKRASGEEVLKLLQGFLAVK